MTARLALLRWVSRVVRREWRQHLLVIAMIAFGIMLAVVSVTTAVRLSRPQAEALGNAKSVVQLWATDGEQDMRPAVEAVVSKFPDTETVAVGSRFADNQVGLYSQNPDGPLGDPWLGLNEGRYPVASGEVALTPRALELLRNTTDLNLTVGGTLDIDGEKRTLVGVVENPMNLDETRALVPLDDLGPWTEAQILLPTDNHPATAELLGFADVGSSEGAPPTYYGGFSDEMTLGAGDNSAALGGYAVGTLLCFLIAILASAGFTVLANRRTRQLGLLAAIGAKPSQLGSVMRLTGAVCGLFGGAAGLAAGVLMSIAITPFLQPYLNHRIYAFDLPWLYLLPALPLALFTAVAAAWWPARRVRSVSAVDAIAARRPTTGGFVWSLLAGLVLLGGGAYLMKVGAPKNSPQMVVGGIAALVFGSLALTPGAVRALGRLADFAPLPVRIAWRDVARNRSRSTSAVAAAAIAIAVPFSLAAFVASLSSNWLPSVPQNVANVWNFDEELKSLADSGTTLAEVKPPTEIQAIANSVPGIRMVPVVAAVDQPGTEQFQEMLATEGDINFGPEYLSFQTTSLRQSNTQGLDTAIATPELLELMGLELPTDGSQMIVTVESELLMERGITKVSRQTDILSDTFPQAILLADLDGVSMTDGLVNRWYLVKDEPFTQAERDRMSAVNNLGIGFSDSPPPFIAIRGGALLAAGMISLGVVAVAMALIRAESMQEDRVLNSVGAAPSTSRAISGATVAGLTLAAAIIAIPVTFLGLMGVYLNPDEAFDFAMPWAELITVLVVVPVVGAGFGWLLTSTKTKPIRLIS